MFRTALLMLSENFLKNPNIYHRRIRKQNIVYLYDGIPLSNWNVLLIHSKSFTYFKKDYVAQKKPP